MANENKSSIELEIVEIEELARAGKEVPDGKRYRIRIDKEKYVVEKATMSGREILRLAGKTPEEYHLYLHSRGGQSKIIQPEEVVDLRTPGVERFTTVKKVNTEG
jgi:hypothetical protein